MFLYCFITATKREIFLLDSECITQTTVHSQVFIVFLEKNGGEKLT